MRLASLVALVLLPPGALAAQSHPLAGRWAVELEAGRTVENGIETPIMAKGVFDVTVAGDSVVGVLTVEPRDGRPARPPIRVAALRSASPSVFAHQGEAVMNVNGTESKYPMSTTISVTAEGDSLKGTVVRVIEGLEHFSPEARPFSGRRMTPAG